MPSPSNQIKAPRDIGKTLADLLDEIVSETAHANLLKIVKNVSALSDVETIRSVLRTVPVDSFSDFVDVLHLHMYVQRLTQPQNDAIHRESVTPVKDAMAYMLSRFGVAESLEIFPYVLTDVLTAHPVDTDRGLVSEYKRKLEELHRLWEQKKAEYRLLSDAALRQIVRGELDNLNQLIRNLLHIFLSTPNYRERQIKPESEQLNLSRSIKANEEKIILAWDKIISFVQESFSEAAKKEKNQRHSNAIKNLKTKFRYCLHTWRGDKDGNPLVNAESIARSLAYGRTRCFEAVTADDAVIRYLPESNAFKTAEKTMEKILQNLKKTGQKDWKTYIRERLAAGWHTAQIYSGLAYYRMVEMKEAAEYFLRHGGKLDQLAVGFAMPEDFLEFSEPLQIAEEAAGLVDGTWTQLRKLVRLRGLDLGLPHGRNGERYHLQLVAEALGKAASKKNLLEFLAPKTKLPKHFEKQLSKTSKDVFQNYKTLVGVSPSANIIQSDSGSETGDIEHSILLLKSLSKLLDHKGNVVVLCENEKSMLDAIELMNSKKSKSDIFDRVIMMAAGSDNQKKLGPFYAVYLNSLFLTTAYDRGIAAFFGIGDSPLRSSTHRPLVAMKTFQPGSRKRYFFGELPYFYLSYLAASQITAVAYYRSLGEKQKNEQAEIAKVFGEVIYRLHRKGIAENKTLQNDIKSIAEIATTYFSRPSKKYGESGDFWQSIRAIDSGRAQLILNTFDPQISNLVSGIDHAISQLKKRGVSLAKIQDFFRSAPIGQGLLKTLQFYADHLDPGLPGAKNICKTGRDTICECYEKLSGKKLNPHFDANLRLTRLVWQRAEEIKTPDFRAKAILLFGSNWMI